MIPQYRTLQSKLPNYRLKKAQYCNTVDSHVPPLKIKHSFFLSLFFFKLEKFLAFCHYGDDYNYDYDDDDNGVYIYLIIIIITIVIIIIIRPQRKWCLHGMSPSPTRHHRH